MNNDKFVKKNNILMGLYFYQSMIISLLNKLLETYKFVKKILIGVFLSIYIFPLK